MAITVLKNTPIHTVVAVSGTSASETIDLTSTLLHGVVKTFDGSSASVVVVAADTITITSHGFATGDRVVYSDGGGTAITGLTHATTYYVIRVDANTVKLATTYENAVKPTSTAVNLTAVGSGSSHKLYKGQFASSPVVNIKAIHWSVPSGNAVITRNSNDLWLMTGSREFDFHGFTDSRDNTSNIVVTTPAGGGTVILEVMKVSGYGDVQHLNQNVG